DAACGCTSGHSTHERLSDERSSAARERGTRARTASAAAKQRRTLVTPPLMAPLASVGPTTLASPARASPSWHGANVAAGEGLHASRCGAILLSLPSHGEGPSECVCVFSAAV